MREFLRSLVIGFPLVIIGIIAIIAANFCSKLQPCGLVGVVVGHFLLSYNMSIMSIFGMVALAGIVVNYAIVMIERINGNLARGMAFREQSLMV